MANKPIPRIMRNFRTALYIWFRWMMEHRDIYGLPKMEVKDIQTMFGYKGNVAWLMTDLIKGDTPPTIQQIEDYIKTRRTLTLEAKERMYQRAANGKAQADAAANAQLDDIKARKAQILAEEEAFYLAHPDKKPDLFNCNIKSC